MEVTKDERVQVNTDVKLVTSTSYTVTTSTSTVPKAPRISITNMTEKEKYHRIKELNNIASKKSREKKKGKIRELEWEEKFELVRREELKKKYEELKKKRDLMNKLIRIMIVKTSK